MSSVNTTTADQDANQAEKRMPAAQRREQLLAAASEVFGERGYAATTTDQVAQAAGISQPYVVRMFGGKEKLFLAVLDRALEKLLSTFGETLELGRAEGWDTARTRGAIGAAYVDLIEDRGILLSLMQGFLMGHDDVIGSRGREGFLILFRLLRNELGMTGPEARDFLAQGMLLNTMLALRMPQEYAEDETARELVDCVFQTKVDLVLRTSAES